MLPAPFLFSQSFLKCCPSSSASAKESTHGDNRDKGILSVDKMDRTICTLSEKESLKKL